MPYSRPLPDATNPTGAFIPVLVLDYLLAQLHGLRLYCEMFEPALLAELDAIQGVVDRAHRGRPALTLPALAGPPASVTEAAAVLGVTERRVRQMIAAGLLPATRAPGARAWHIPRPALAAASVQRQRACGARVRPGTVAPMTPAPGRRPALPFQRATLSTHDLPLEPVLDRHDAPPAEPELIDWSTATPAQLRAEAARIATTAAGTSPAPAADRDWRTASPEEFQAEVARLTGRTHFNARSAR